MLILDLLNFNVLVPNPLEFIDFLLPGLKDQLDEVIIE